MRVCFDYDVVKYQVGYASENRSIQVVHRTTGDELTFANRTEFYGRNKKGGWLADVNSKRTSPFSLDEFTIQDVQVMKPFKLVEDILNAKINSVLKHLGTKDFYGWLGDGKVFRHAEATILPYKGERATLKPLALARISEMLLTNSRYKGKLAMDSLEADDHLAMDSWEAFKVWSKTKHTRDRLVVVTVDKDARGCTGHLFNPDEMKLPLTIQGFGKLYWKDNTASLILSGHGRVWLLAQMLMGDNVDNIDPTHLAGIDGYGPATVFKALQGCKDDKQALEVVVNTYKQWYPAPVAYTSFNGNMYTKDWLGVAEEMWMLLRMRRWKDDNLSFKDVLENLS